MLARVTRARITIGTGVLVAALSACHHRAGAAPALDTPTLDTLTPSAATVSQGEQVTVIVSGRHFDSLNTVRFGPIELRQVPRVSHTRTASTLRFTVPVNDEQLPDRGGAPVRPLVSGRYDVQITTTRGTTNAVPFTLTNGRTDRE